MGFSSSFRQTSAFNITATAPQVGALPIPDAGGLFTDDTIVGALQALGFGKANKAQEVWITPTFTGGASDGSSGCRYRKNSFGKVEFKGIVSSTTNGTSFLTLPVSYRPLTTQYFIVASSLTSVVRITVNIDGTVICNSTATWVSLIQVAFYTD